MYCNNCNKQFNNISFCPNCGNKLIENSKINEINKTTNNLKNVTALDIIVPILIGICILFNFIVEPLIVAFSAPDVVGGWVFLLGPPIMLINTCPLIIVALIFSIIYLVNNKKKFYMQIASLVLIILNIFVTSHFSNSILGTDFGDIPIDISIFIHIITSIILFVDIIINTKKNIKNKNKNNY